MYGIRLRCLRNGAIWILRVDLVAVLQCVSVCGDVGAGQRCVIYYVVVDGFNFFGQLTTFEERGHELDVCRIWLLELSP